MHSATACDVSHTRTKYPSETAVRGWACRTRTRKRHFAAPAGVLLCSRSISACSSRRNRSDPASSARLMCGVALLAIPRCTASSTRRSSSNAAKPCSHLPEIPCGAGDPVHTQYRKRQSCGPHPLFVWHCNLTATINYKPREDALNR